MAKQNVILQKFYVYDPALHVGDELGGLRVMGDDKGENKHVLAVQQQVQWWMDQGLLGREELSKLGDNSKKLLAQITRGRSENVDDDEYVPKRLPKYSKQAQSGAPAHALTSSPSASSRKNRPRPKLEPNTSTNPENPQPIAKPKGPPVTPPGGAPPPPTTPPRG